MKVSLLLIFRALAPKNYEIRLFLLFVLQLANISNTKKMCPRQIDYFSFQEGVDHVVDKYQANEIILSSLMLFLCVRIFCLSTPIFEWSPKERI